MLGRRRWLKATLLGFFAFLPGRRALAQEGGSINSATRLGEQNIASLEDQLKNGLRAVTPEQLEFIRIVVQHVDSGRLPRALVNLVYKWSLERNSRVPFPYFQYALRVLAKRRGIHLS